MCEYEGLHCFVGTAVLGWPPPVDVNNPVSSPRYLTNCIALLVVEKIRNKLNVRFLAVRRITWNLKKKDISLPRLGLVFLRSKLELSRNQLIFSTMSPSSFVAVPKMTTCNKRFYRTKHFPYLFCFTQSVGNFSYLKILPWIRLWPGFSSLPLEQVRVLSSVFPKFMPQGKSFI